MLRGIEEMEVELDTGGNARGNAGNAKFSLCNAKISQSLRNFAMHIFFAMIAKFRYHSENSLS